MADTNEQAVAEDELDPLVQPESAKAWLSVITQAEKEFQDYQDRSDNIDKQYANLARLAETTRDRQFQLFWANIQVLGPSIYSRPPVPVVVPRFKDQRPLARQTSEMLERCAVVGFELEDMDATMRLVRDDVTILARGVIWLRYETKKENDNLYEKVCIDHVDRKDFLHDPARKWPEVDWVAKRAWLTKDEAKKRFKKSSGKAYEDLAYEEKKDDTKADDGRRKASVWEIWCKSQNKVVWVSEGCEDLLDSGEPHLDLEGFFPCPRPAYATIQRRSLVPVPDMVFYKDQLEEINELTARMGALGESLKLRGFYPSGAGELGDAVEAAVKSQADNVVLIPISNWSLLGGGAAKDMIVWLPLDMVSTVITQLVEIRRQLIEDVYQITGLSDIMRGSTVASETLGAQQLKSQYGSIRIRDRQDELIRIARDTTRIMAEIMSENFQSKTLLDMSQMQIPTDADIAKQVKPLEQQVQAITKQVEEAQQDPQLQQMAQQQPDKAQQVLQQAQQQVDQLGEQIQKLNATPTVEKIMKFLRDERLRPFVLDIETDSTIAPDENAQKERATEYLTAMGGLLAQAVPAVQQLPQIAPLIADTIKFAQGQFRVGRSMDQSVEEFVEAMKGMASQPKPPDPAAQKAEADSKAAQTKMEMDAQAQQADIQLKQQDAQIRMQESQVKAQSDQADLQIKQQTAAHELEVKKQDAALRAQETMAKMQQAADSHSAEMAKLPLEIAKLQAEIEKIRAGTVAAVSGAQVQAESAKVQAETAQATVKLKADANASE